MLLSYTINKTPATVISYLSDMNRFVSVHPVITKMKPVAGNKFIVHETSNAGLLPFSFRYLATVTADYKNKIITMQARVLKLARIHMVFIVSEHNGGSMIKEEINFHSWLPVKGIMKMIFKKQHAQLFKNIEKRHL